MAALNKFKILLSPNQLKIRLPTNELEKALKLVNRPERIDNLLLKLPERFDSFEFELKGQIPLTKQQMAEESCTPRSVLCR